MNPVRSLIVDLSGPDLQPAEARWLRQRQPGGVCLFARNFSTPQRTARLIREVRDALERDALIATDQEGGAVLRRLDVPLPPTPQGLGVLDDPQAAYQAGQVAARGLLELGVNWNFAPSLDVNVDPLNPVIGERSFGADPARVAVLGVAWAQGSEAAGVMSAVKHFPGHGDTRVDSHLALPVVDKPRTALEAVEWRPFREAVRAGLGSVMTAHILYTALDAEHPATVSSAVLTGLLRREWGYDGVVVTDAMDMRAVADRYPQGRGAALALQAGADAVLVCGHGHHEVTEMHARALDAGLRDGTLLESRLHEAAERLNQAERRFPGRPRPYTKALRAADEALVEDWAQRMLTWAGPAVKLDPSKVVLLLAPSEPALGGPYGDCLAGPALAGALRPAFPHVQFIPTDEPAAISAMLEAHPTAPVVLATTERWIELASVKSLADNLMTRNAPALHLALWDTAVVNTLKLPSLITYGFRPANLHALTTALRK